MTEPEANEDYPVSIDLGKKIEAIPAAATDDANPKNEKSYPSVYLSGIEGLEKLPPEGCVLVKYKLGDVTIRKPKGGGAPEVSCEFQMQRICMPDDMGGYGDDDSEGADGDMGSIVDSMAKKAGVKFGGKADDDADAALEPDDDEDDKA
jgi:hypothetical protein